MDVTDRTPPGITLKLDEWERHMVRRALDMTAWNVTRAAKLLALTRDTLRYRIEKYSLSAPLK